MELDRQVCSRARLARDPRFDGRCFIGVLGSLVFCVCFLDMVPWSLLREWTCLPPSCRTIKSTLGRCSCLPMTYYRAKAWLLKKLFFAKF